MAVLCTAFLAVGPAPARADNVATYAPSPLTAALVLHDARKALGSAADGAYKLVETSRGGGMVSTTTTLTDSKDYLSTNVRGPFTTAWGSYSGQGWNQDENGIVTLDTGFHASENPDDRALAHPEDPANRVTMLGITVGTDPAYAVDVDPPGGEHQVRYYDKATFHLARIVRWGADRLEHVTTYDDYRTAYGRTRAYHWHYGDGRADNDTDTRITSLEKLAAPPDIGIPPNRSLFTFASLDPVVLPTSFHGNAIFVRINIAGRGLDFLLDSGASGIYIDPGVARQLGLPIYGKSSGTMGGNVDISTTIVPAATIGSIHLKNTVFKVAPIDEQGGNARAVGLLGYDFLASAIIGIDFEDSTVTAYPEGTVPTHDPVSKIPVQLDDGVPRAEASFEGVPGHFLIDLGAFRTVLYPSYVAKLPQKINIQQRVGATFVGGNETMSQYTVRDFVFGGVKYASATMMVPQNSLADLHEYDGLLGRDVLDAYTLYFDYGRSAVYAKYDG